MKISTNSAVLNSDSLSTISNTDEVFTYGYVTINITSALCDTVDRYICLQYAIRETLTPEFRDVTNGNDWICQDVSQYMSCVDGKLKKFDVSVDIII